jgi:hypothetical protein
VLSTCSFFTKNVDFIVPAPSISFSLIMPYFPGKGKAGNRLQGCG